MTHVTGAWGALRGELGYPPPTQVPTGEPPGSHRNVLTQPHAFAQASAEPALPYLRPSPLDDISGILQDSVPGAPPLGRLLQGPRMEGIPTSSTLL